MTSLTAEKHGEEKAAQAAELMNPSKPEPALLEKVYSYLKERRVASPPQIARDLNLKISTVMEVLLELKRCGMITLMHE